MAMLSDAANYADAYGITVDEAAARLSLQRKVGDLDAELASSEGATYAGLWIQNDPVFEATVAFTEDPAAALKRHPLEADVSAIIKPALADYSLASLEDEEQRLHYLLPADLSLWIDVAANRVIIHPASLETAASLDIASLKLSAADTYFGDVVTSHDTADIYAGLPLNGAINCTSGLSIVHNGDNIQGITTAAHCANALTYNGVALVFKGEREAGSDDEQWHTTPGFVIHPWAQDGANSHRPILSKNPRSSQAVGATVCKYGRSTGYTCGEIINKDYCWPNAACTYIQVSRFNTNLVDGGDSGGPVYAGNDAYGIVKGERCFITCYDMIYTAENYIESGLGAIIMLGQ